MSESRTRRFVLRYDETMPNGEVFEHHSGTFDGLLGSVGERRHEHFLVAEFRLVAETVGVRVRRHGEVPLADELARGPTEVCTARAFAAFRILRSMNGSRLLGRVATWALIVVGIAFNLPLLAGFVYESVLLVQAYGWWVALLQLAVPLAMLWWYGVPALLDWYEDRRIVRKYLPIAQAWSAERAAARAAMPPSMVVRGSFSALVDAERTARHR